MLLEAFEQKEVARLRELPMLSALRTVWRDHFERSEDGVVRLTERRGGKRSTGKKKRPREAAAGEGGSSEGGSSTESSAVESSDIGPVESPYDPDARFCNRRSVKWVGYRVHLTETCDQARPRIIVHACTTSADVHEARRTTEIHEATAAKGLPPSEHLADAAYVSAKLFTRSWQEHRIRLIGPMRKNPQAWQKKTPGAFTHEDFAVDWDRKVATCPEGKQSSSWGTYQTGAGIRIRASFRKSDCGPCPARHLCTKAESRSLALRPREEYEALQAIRERMQTEEGKKLYALRAGVESAMAQGVRRCGMRRARYRGLKKTALQHVATAVAMNLARVSAWLGDQRPAPTRTSRFARLAA